MKDYPDRVPMDDDGTHYDLCNVGACGVCSDRHECARKHKPEMRKNPGQATSCSSCTGKGMECWGCSESRK